MTATATVSLSIGSRPAATAVTCMPPSNLLTPVAPGTVLAPIVVTPPSWVGTASLSGANASSFVIGGVAPNLTLNVGAAPLGDGAFEVVVTVTP